MNVPHNRKKKILRNVIVLQLPSLLNELDPLTVIRIPPDEIGSLLFDECRAQTNTSLLIVCLSSSASQSYGTECNVLQRGTAVRFEFVLLSNKTALSFRLPKVSCRHLDVCFLTASNLI